jgi:hypothetical protein
MVLFRTIIKRICGKMDIIKEGYPTRFFASLRMTDNGWCRALGKPEHFLSLPCALRLAPRIYCPPESNEGSLPSDCGVWFLNIAFIFIFMLVFSVSSQVQAKSPAGLVDEGNSAYNAGQYDKAITSYDEALKGATESQYVYFNKGAALYKKGDYTGACEAFAQAARNTRDPNLEAKSKFNLGNSDYKKAADLKEKDLNKALQECSNSIGHYREAINLDPKLKEAAQNIELVRLDMKNILDQINKQKEAGNDEQKKKQEAAKQLQELIKDQEAGIEKNQKIDAERAAKGDTPKTIKEMQDLSKEQKDIRDKTGDVLKKMQEGKTDQSREGRAAKHLENAGKEQDAASGNLDQKNTKASANNQQEAIKELKEALDSMHDNSNNNTDQKGDQKEKQAQQSSSGDQSQQDKNDQSLALSTVSDGSENARDILTDEKRQRDEQRRSLAIRSYKEVDKDW